MDKLKNYKLKRDFKKTSEPKGKEKKSSKKLRFVVQHHLARRDHYDFRLEYNGVLKSWAVPKGPSYKTTDKRLAVMVEDHPFEYRNFEGTIPKGEYGGGTVMLWDEGFWECEGNIREGLSKGSIKFTLHGKRLKGKWTLVKFKEDNWLLIKERDNISLFEKIEDFNTSIRTGRTMEEITNNVKKIRNSKKKSIVEGIEISNGSKLVYQKPKITKWDVVNYYKQVTEKMFPYISNRLLSTVRCPNGVEGEKFFKKHLGENKYGLASLKIKSENGKRDDYYYMVDESGIIGEAQMNGIEFHIGGSKVGEINKPNTLVFDLDPDENLSLSKVRQGVRDLKSILDKLKLKAFLKTSGGKGYHVVVPTKKLKNWKQFSEFAENIVKVMVESWPDSYTSNIRKEKRKGKIFIDWFRNKKGSTSVAPYSLRAREGACVSMPIKWSELDKVKPNGIDIKEAIRRLKRKDPWEGFFEINQ